MVMVLYIMLLSKLIWFFLNLRTDVIRYELHLASLTSRLMWCVLKHHIVCMQTQSGRFSMNNGCFSHKASCELRRQCLDLVVLVSRHLGLRLKGLVFSLNLYAYGAFLDISFHFIYCIAKSSLDILQTVSFLPWKKVTWVKATWRLVKVWRRLSPSCAWCQRCGGMGTARSRSWHDTLSARGSTSSPDPAGSRCTAAERSSSPRSFWKQKESHHFLHLPIHILTLFGSWHGFCIHSEMFPCTFHLDVSETSISVLYGLINMSDCLLRLRNSTVRCVIFSLLDSTQVWSANREPHTKEPVHYIAYWDKSELASSCRTSQTLRDVRCQLKSSLLRAKSL